MIICKRPAHPDDHLQKTDPSGWSFAKGRPTITTGVTRVTGVTGGRRRRWKWGGRESREEGGEEEEKLSRTGRDGIECSMRGHRGPKKGTICSGRLPLIIRNLTITITTLTISTQTSRLISTPWTSWTISTFHILREIVFLLLTFLPDEEHVVQRPVEKERIVRSKLFLQTRKENGNFVSYKPRVFYNLSSFIKMWWSLW